VDVLKKAAGLPLRPAALPLASAALGAGCYCWLLLERAAELRLPAYDTAFFEQVVWNLGHGGGFSAGGFYGRDFLGLHFSPLLALPSVLELAWPDSRALSIVHAVVAAATAPAAYLFLAALFAGRPRSSLAAAALATPIPFWAEVQQAVRAGFHPEAIGTTLVLLLGWAGLRGRWRLSCVLALSALASREDEAYGVAVIGVLLLTSAPDRCSRRLGLALAAGGLAAGALLELAVMPALRGWSPNPLSAYYGWLGHASPAAVLAALARPQGWLAFGGMVAGLGFLPLLRARWLAFALPPLLGDLLSAHVPQPELGLQYGLPLMVPLLVAGGLGARRLLRDPRPIPYLLALAAPALLVAAALGPFPGAGWSTGPGDPALGRLRACTARLPSRAPVAADDDVAAPLAARPVLRLLTAARPGDLVVVDRAGVTPGYWDLQARTAVLEALPRQRRPLLLCDDGRFQLWGPMPWPTPSR
jgi:hypothetical protein